jgi:hypothetical protein
VVLGCLLQLQALPLFMLAAAVLAVMLLKLVEQAAMVVAVQVATKTLMARQAL